MVGPLAIAEQDVPRRRMRFLALEIDPDLRGHLPAAPTDFAFPPQLTQSIMLQPCVEFSMRQALELSAVVEVTFADPYRLRAVGQRFDQGVGMGRDDQLCVLRRLNQHLGHQTDRTGLG